MSHEQNVGNPEKLITTAVAIGLSAAALTGCGIGDYEASSAETPNPAAIAEQEAVDLVGKYREHPGGIRWIGDCPRRGSRRQ